MMQVLRDPEGKTKALISDGDLVVGDHEVADWFQNGVPSRNGVKRGHTITEEEVRVKREDPLFHLALLDVIEEQGLDIVDVLEKAETINDPNKLDGTTYAATVGAQAVTSEGRAGGGANIQMDLSAKPTNPHDVQGVQRYLLSLETPADHSRITRDPAIYEFHDSVDWVWPIADANGAARNVMVPDETVLHTKDYRDTVERTQRQVTDVPPNQGVPRDPGTAWKPVQREAAPRFQKSKRRAVTIQEVSRG